MVYHVLALSVDRIDTWRPVRQSAIYNRAQLIVQSSCITFCQTNLRRSV